MNTKMRIAIFLILPSIGVQSLAEAGTVSDSLYEVFLLHPSIRYSYAYSSYGVSGDEMTSGSTKDSGQVEYIILDSTNTNDSTRTWHLLEIRNFLRNSKSLTPMISTDTTYLVSDSASLTLYEDRRGNHELTCSGLIWRFPLHQLRGEILQSVFRYWNTSEPLFAWQWNNASHNGVYGTGADTIVLSKDLGYSQRHFNENWTSGYMWGNSTVAINSLHKPTGVSINRSVIPNSIFLEQNYPNPFNPSTTFTTYLPFRQYGSLLVFNLIGQHIATIKEGIFFAGTSTVSWDASAFPSGTYFCRFQTLTRTETIKLLLIK